MRRLRFCATLQRLMLTRCVAEVTGEEAIAMVEAEFVGERHSREHNQAVFVLHKKYCECVPA